MYNKIDTLHKMIHCGTTHPHHNNKKESAIVFLLAVLISFLFIGTASAATYYVNATSGDDAHPGTLSEPFLTIQAGADVVVAGDTVIVQNGTYNDENAEPGYSNATLFLTTSGTTGNQITFQSEHKHGAILDGGNSSTMKSAIIFVRLDYVTNINIDGFIIRNYHAAGIDMYSAAYVNVTNVEIYNIGRAWTDPSCTAGDGIVPNGIKTQSTAHDILLDKLEIHDVGRQWNDACAAEYTSWRWDHILYLAGYNITLSNSKIYNAFSGFALKIDGHDANIGTWPSHVIVNNVFGHDVDEDHQHGTGFITSVSDHGVYDSSYDIINNNVFYNGSDYTGEDAIMYNRRNISTWTIKNNAASYSNLYYHAPGYGEGIPTTANNTLGISSSDFNMTDPENNDFTLLSNATYLINQGISDTYTPTYDFLGNLRDNTPDIGAYEYVVEQNDNAIKSHSPDTVFNDLNYLPVGELNGDTHRSWIWFDTSEYNTTDIITNATLSLHWYYSHSTRNKSTNVGIYFPNATVDTDYLTWNNSSDGVPWDTPGGTWLDADGATNGTTPFASKLFPIGAADNANHTFNITTLVQSIVNESRDNNGFFIIANETNLNYIAFSSLDNTTSEHIPTLTIEHELPPPPTINTWQNNDTLDSTLDITVNTGQSVLFNVTANQVIDTWTWERNETDQSINYDNITLSWVAPGSKTVTITATNTNGTSSIVQWNVTVQDDTTWANSTYGYRKYISFDEEDIYGINTNFTILVDIIDTNLANNSQSDGGDITFYILSTQMPHDLELYNSTTGHIRAWVRMSELSDTNNILHMYYGNTEASNQWDAVNTWQDYSLVMHLDDDPTVNVLDSSGSGNNGTAAGSMTSGDEVPGKIGNALDFDGLDDYVEITGLLNEPATGTITAWVDISGVDSSGGSIISLGDNMGLLADHPLYDTISFYYYDIGWHVIESTDEITGDGWTYLGASFQPNTQELIKNAGVSLASEANTDAIYYTGQGPNTQIGRHGNSNTAMDLEGTIDEVRFTELIRDVDWINTEYNNQNDPAAFYTEGSQELYGTSPSITSWENNKTSNDTLDFTMNTSEAVLFNATCNQSITTWNWYSGGIDQSHNFDNLTFEWYTNGTRTIIVNGTNTNGTTNSITWNVDIINASGGDTTAPTYSDVDHSTTEAGELCVFSIKYNDETGLEFGSSIFATNNTGVWVNESAVNWSVTPQYANKTKTLNSTHGAIVGYRWYADDSAGNDNNTPIYTLTVQDTNAPNVVTDLSAATGNFWHNFSWTNPTDTDFDYSNVYIDNVWIINTSIEYYNLSALAHNTSDISIRTVDNVGNIGTWRNRSSTIPNNDIVITNASDWSGNEGETVYVDFDATDDDLDTPTFSCNRTDIFTDFSTSTGIGNWLTSHTDADTHSIDFGVNDGYGADSNYTMTITIAESSPSNLYVVSTTSSTITWAWANPTSFDTIMVYIDDVWKANTSTEFYTASSLNGQTTYTIKLIAVYNSMNSEPVTNSGITSSIASSSSSGSSSRTIRSEATATSTPSIPSTELSLTNINILDKIGGFIADNPISINRINFASYNPTYTKEVYNHEVVSCNIHPDSTVTSCTIENGYIKLEIKPHLISIFNSENDYITLIDNDNAVHDIEFTVNVFDFMAMVNTPDIELSNMPDSIFVNSNGTVEGIRLWIVLLISALLIIGVTLLQRDGF